MAALEVLFYFNLFLQMRIFKSLLLPALFSISLWSCSNDKNRPDISAVKVDLKVERFDEAIYKIDTVDIAKSIASLQQKYPDFTRDYIENILGLSADSLAFPGSRHADALKLFLRDYRVIKDSSNKIFGDFSKQKAEIETACRYVKYYFPKYTLPSRIYTFIGPVDAMFETSFGFQGDIKSPTAFGVALQFHLGENFSFYRSLQGQAQFPDYILRRLDPATISINCMKNVVDDLFPDNSAGRPLIEQMVEKGKRLYLLDKFVPDVDEHLKIGYTEKQLKDCYTNEAAIWGLFLNNDLLNNAEQNVLKNYIGDSPKTQELGEDAPGNIASFSGWQIVKLYMDKYPDTKLEDLMMLPARDVYAKSKYKPK